MEGLKNRRSVKQIEAWAFAFACTFYIGIPVAGYMIRPMDGIASIAFVWALLNRHNQTCRLAGRVLIWGQLFILSGVFSIATVALENHAFYPNAWLKLFRLSLPFMMMYVASRWKKEECETFTGGLLWLGTVQALFALVMYWFQIPMFCASQTSLRDGKIIFRAGGFVGDAGSFGILCAFLSGITIVVLIFRISKHRVPAITCLLANVLGLWASEARTAMHALLAGLVGLLICRSVRKRHYTGGPKRLWIFCAGLAGGAFVFFLIAGCNQTIQRMCVSGLKCLFEQIGTPGTLLERANGLLSERLGIWIQYLLILVGQPFLQRLVGNGYYLFEENLHVYSFAAGQQVFDRPAHNMYLCVLVGMGLLGWLFFSGFFISVIKEMQKKFERSDFYKNCVALLLIAELVTMLMDDSLSMINSAAILFVLVGIATHVQAEQEKESGNIEERYAPNPFAVL